MYLCNMLKDFVGDKKYWCSVKVKTQNEIACKAE